MTNTVSFSIVSSVGGVEGVTLVQDAVVRDTIHATLNGSSSVHDITNTCASPDGTQVTGKTRWFFFMEETVNLAISPPTTSPQTTATLDIENYQDITGSLSAVDGAAVIAFIKSCALPPIP
jgi:hypothetical protein